jgi:hypothetical protein
VDEAGDNEEEATLDGEFEFETSKEDGVTDESTEKRDFQSVPDLRGKELDPEPRSEEKCPLIKNIKKEPKTDDLARNAERGH